MAYPELDWSNQEVQPGYMISQYKQNAPKVLKGWKDLGGTWGSSFVSLDTNYQVCGC